MRKLKIFFLILFFLFSFLYAVVLIGIEGFYRKGLTYVDQPYPSPTTIRFSPRAHEALWYGEEQNGRVKVSPGFPWNIFKDYSFLFIKAYIDDLRKIHSFQRIQNGSDLCWHLVRNITIQSAWKEKRDLTPRPHWQWAGFSLSIWISRNWTTEQILDTYLDRMYFGRGTYGMNAAAKVYFKKTPDELTDRQLASLIGLLRSPSIQKDPAQWKERADKVEQMILDGRK
jgi:hypothetical protein